MATRSRPYNKLYLNDFGGGLDLVTDIAELDPRNHYDAWNVQVWNGSIFNRFGADEVFTATSDMTYVFQSSQLNVGLTYEGTTLYRWAASGTWGSSWTSKTSLDTVGTHKPHAAEFTTPTANFIVFTWKGRIYSWDGSTFGGPYGPTALEGPLAVWQNKVWASDGSRLFWSAAGDHTTWTTGTDYVDVMETDGTKITALGTGNGMDVVGRAGLLVFKTSSVHNVYDSTTGAYTTVDTNAGAAGAESVTSLFGDVYFCNRHGIWTLRGDRAEPIHAPIRPLWDTGVYAAASQYCIFPNWNRIYVSRGLGWILEYVPESASWWYHFLSHNGGTTKRGVISATYGFGGGGAGNSIFPIATVIDTNKRSGLHMWLPPGVDTWVTPSLADYTSSGSNLGIYARYRFPWIQGNQGDEFRVRRWGFKGDANTFASLDWHIWMDYDRGTAIMSESDWDLFSSSTQAVEWKMMNSGGRSCYAWCLSITDDPNQGGGYSGGGFGDIHLPNDGISRFNNFRIDALRMDYVTLRR